MNPIRLSVCNRQAIPTLYNVTLQLIGPIRMLWRNWSVVNTVQGLYSHTSFSSQLTNGSNKLECYITLGCKGLTGANTLVYLAQSYVTNKLECCEGGPRSLSLSFNALLCLSFSSIFFNLSVVRKKVRTGLHNNVLRKSYDCKYGRWGCVSHLTLTLNIISTLKIKYPAYTKW